MSETEHAAEFNRAELVVALRELLGAWEGEMPPELAPEVEEKLRRLREEVGALLEGLGEGT